MADYILASSYGRSDVQDQLWYAMEEVDKTTLASEQNIVFGDKVYVILTKKYYIMGNNNTWYEM